MSTERNWSMLGSMSTICPLDCTFCYRKGTSPQSAMIDDIKFKSVEEIDALCSDIKNKNKIFDFFEDVGEYLANKDFFRILEKFREYFPSETIDFTTSGLNLTEEKIKKLSENGPIFLQYSLNSATPEVRKDLMNDKHPEVAINAVALFKKYNILFSGNIVGWPTMSLEDIRNTIYYLDQHEPVSIKINLPSYSKFFPEKDKFDFSFQIWDDLIQLIETIRPDITAPITYEPFLYKNSAILPIVTGVIKNSPAYNVGIEHGDIIQKINSELIMYREQGRKLLIQKDENDIFRNITVKRGERLLDFKLEDKDSIYPYSTAQHTRTGKTFGIFIHQGFDITYFSTIKKMIQKYSANKVLIMSSVLLFQKVKSIFNTINNIYFNMYDIDIIPVQNDYYGGNIIIGDLLVVDDFILAINEYLQSHESPDLIIIPGSSFNNNYDLIGKHFSEIEKEVHIVVDKINNEKILV